METGNVTAVRPAATGRSRSEGELATAKPLKIAVAASGLGHIFRGIEAWAADVAVGLRRAGQDVTLFQAFGEPDEPWKETLPCARRFDKSTQRWVQRLSRVGGWRFGFGSGYQAEQTTFTRSLWGRIRRDYDLLHVQDPWVALLMDRLHRMGLSRPRVILAHGTEEPPATLARYSILQHLAPCYVEEWEPHRPASQSVYAIPNFVDADRFRPGDVVAARREWGLPEDHLVVLCVAAIKRHHKRIDWLIREFAEFSRQYSGDATLVVGGGREAETDAVIAEGKALLGDRIRFLERVPRERIHTLYQAADVFALASLHEMMPIALLEALASGLPVACNDTPTLRWMCGPAGLPRDLSREGGMAEQLLQLAAPGQRANFSQAARRHAEETFSEPVVIQQILSMYSELMRS